jgi:hypothetical protein
VDIVDPAEMKASVASVLKLAPIATGVECTVILPRGLHVADRGANSTSRIGQTACGAATKATDVTVRFACDDGLVSDEAKRQSDEQAWELVDSPLAEAGSENRAVREMPIQLQLRYTLPSGDEMLSVIRTTRSLCTDRSLAESDLGSTVSALAAIHDAAQLAQKGDYQAARLGLISTQRLLQRAMRTRAHQQDYMSFIVQAEKLDQFMREVQQQEAVFGRASGSSRQKQRDDESAKAMFQMKSVSSAAFHARD